jgi:H/ACA ribonucleoprotein complex subunit 4
MESLQSLNFSIINIDKPSGPTSFQVSQFIKNSLNLQKTAHGGTLDPQVSGVLPILLGRACKIMDYFLKREKTYVGIMRLHKDHISDEILKKQMTLLTGKITQLPPVKSRVKREERQREVKQFEILERKEKDILFIAHVQAGTYIRKLCDDLGKKLGGAHMLELRRTQASIFPEAESITLYDFETAVSEFNKGNPEKLNKILIPAEKAIQKVLPTINANPQSLKQLLTGKPLHKEDLLDPLPEQSTFTLFIDDRFIGIYHKTQEEKIIARPDFVLN